MLRHTARSLAARPRVSRLRVSGHYVTQDFPTASQNPQSRAQLLTHAVVSVILLILRTTAGEGPHGVDALSRSSAQKGVALVDICGNRGESRTT